MRTRIILLSLLTMLLAPALFAQEQPVKQRGTTETTKEQNTKARETKQGAFVDEDGDGIDDAQRQDQTRKQKRERKRQRTQDTFIDADGDGINDNRCNGVCVSPSGARARRGGCE